MLPPSLNPGGQPASQRKQPRSTSAAALGISPQPSPGAQGRGRHRLAVVLTRRSSDRPWRGAEHLTRASPDNLPDPPELTSAVDKLVRSADPRPLT